MSADEIAAVVRTAVPASNGDTTMASMMEGLHWFNSEINEPPVKKLASAHDGVQTSEPAPPMSLEDLFEDLI